MISAIHGKYTVMGPQFKELEIKNKEIIDIIDRRIKRIKNKRF